MGMEFVRNWYGFLAKFCAFVKKVSQHAELHKGHTLHPHGQHVDQAPARVHFGALPPWGDVPHVPQRGGPDKGGNAEDGVVDLLPLVVSAVLGDLQLVHQRGEKEHRVLRHLQHGDVVAVLDEREVGW